MTRDSVALRRYSGGTLMMNVPPPAPPPPLLSVKPSRRSLLKYAGVGGVVLLGGVWVWRTLGRFGPAAPGLQVFDADEFVVVQKACEAFFPGRPEVPFSAEEVGTPPFLDAYVASLYDDTQLLFRILIRTLKLSPIPTHGRSFSSLPLEQRQQVLQDWRVSDLRVRRGGYQSLSFAIKLGYFEDDRVRAAAGFTPGCAVPTENRPTGHGGRTL